MTGNLVFDLLDRRVVDGGALDQVVWDGDRTLDVAALVELSGAYGGALRHFGVESGTSVSAGAVDSLPALVTVLGVLRVGAVIDLAGAADFAGIDAEFTVAISAGRADPAGTVRVDDDAPAVVLPDGTEVRHQELAAAIEEGRSAAGDYDTILAALTALHRGEVLVFASPG